MRRPPETTPLDAQLARTLDTGSNPTRRVVLSILVLALSTLAWWSLHRPQSPPDWSQPFQCMSYWSRADQSFDDGADVVVPTAAIDAELALVAKYTGCIRTYHVTNGMQRVPELAARHGLQVALGVWLSPDLATRARDIETAIDLAARHPNVTRLIIGNESIQHDDMTVPELTALLDAVRARTKTPVSTAENWFVWLNEPALARSVDFIAAHILPYWHHARVEGALVFSMKRYEWLQNAFPDKPLWIGEIGWPSAGPEYGDASPSLVGQASFFRTFAAYAAEHDIAYNLLEVFDQPWKIETGEGRVGAHWGLLAPDGQLKFPLVGPVVANDGWWSWALVSGLLALALSAWLFARVPRLRWPGEVLVLVVLHGLTAVAAMVVITAGREYMFGQWLIWTLVVPATALSVLVIGALVVEAAEVIGDAPLPVTVAALRPALPSTEGALPFVSIHVPCRNEPPAMVIETLASLLRLDYPAFEVIIIDNNSSDEATWRPVEAYARSDARLRLHVLKDWPGYKAGALNFALSVTAPEAEIIAVVDADYQVAADWLRRLVPLMRDDVVVVQAPQDHRPRPDLFAKLAHDEYGGFFRIGMIQRNEKNAIIQHGTMTLIRRDVLAKQRWAEWCIVEDAELGLRLNALGYRAIYVAESFGQGLVPSTFSAACTQRARWAYGAVRVTLAHAKLLFGLRPGLSRAQRARYLGGWLPWFADALHLLFSVAGLVASLFFLIDQRAFPPPELALPFIVFSALRWVFTLATYYKRMGIGLWRTFTSALLGVAFTNTIGVAVVRALFGGRMPFRRTDKADTRSRWWQALAKVRVDMVLAVALLGVAVALPMRYGRTVDALMWGAVLALQAVPGWAAIVMTVIGRAGKVAGRGVAP